MKPPQRIPRPQTPLERMTDLTRRLVAVPKAEVQHRKAKRRKPKHG